MQVYKSNTLHPDVWDVQQSDVFTSYICLTGQCQQGEVGLRRSVLPPAEAT